MRLAAALMLFTTLACTRTTSDETVASPTVSPTPAPTPCSVTDGSREAKESDGTATATAQLSDVRYNANGCPRVVFEFEEQVPNHVVKYTDPPFSECGSGEEISTKDWDAEAFLSVRLEPAASADLNKEGAPPTYSGPRDIEVGGVVLKHLKVACDFEAVMEWIVGVDERHDFAITTLDDPPRIVIDISET